MRLRSWERVGSQPGVGPLAHAWNRGMVRSEEKCVVKEPVRNSRVLVLYTQQLFSKAGPQTNSVSITWNFLDKRILWLCCRLTDSETLRVEPGL